jgi:hypothetical protein
VSLFWGGRSLQHVPLAFFCAGIGAGILQPHHVRSLLQHSCSPFTTLPPPPPACAPPPPAHTQMANVMDTDELSPEQEADLAAIRARKKQIVTAHRIKKGVANNRCVWCVCGGGLTCLGVLCGV